MIFEWRLEERSADGDARVVDDDVGRRHETVNLVGKQLHREAIADIDVAHEQRAVAELSGERVETRLIDVARCDPGTLAGKGECRGAADAAACTRDDNDTIAEVHSPPQGIHVLTNGQYVWRRPGPRLYSGQTVATAAKRAARPKRRIRLDNDERRAQLLALARRAFSDRSYDDVSVDDLAREARISKGLLYHYFPTKRDLYVAGLREIADELVEKITTQRKEGIGQIERMRAGLAAYLEHISQHSRAFISLMRGGIGSDPEVAAVVDGVRQRMIDMFLAESQFAEILAKDARFHTTVRGWIGFVEGATLDWCETQRMSRTALHELLTQIVTSIMQTVTPQIVASATKK